MIVTGWFVDQELRFFLSDLNQKDLTILRDMMQAGTITPVIDRRFTFGEVAKALAYVETGRARGKVIVTVE
jgi:NADPH:quinone reductase-like Zn-dependent oxidoreductase